MPDVYVVGGRGYVGSRLTASLENFGYDVEAIDPGYLTEETPDPSQDVTDFRFPIPKDGKPVIWLACIHRVPDEDKLSAEDYCEWNAYAEELMVDCPQEWHEEGHPVIYVSSMQIVTQKTLDIYAKCKRQFEQWAVGTPGVRVIRPGTVWGGLNKPSDPTNRVHTVVNRFLTTGELPDDNWRAYTTAITKLIDALMDALLHCERGELPGDVLTCTDWARPCVRENLADGHAFQNARGFVAGRGDWPVPPHPMSRLAAARDLPWKEEA